MSAAQNPIWRRTARQGFMTSVNSAEHDDSVNSGLRTAAKSGNSGAVRFLRLIDRPPLRIDHVAGASDTLVIAFASIGHDPTRPPSPEFVASATALGRSALFVSDDSRSWANAEGFATALQDAVARTGPFARIITIGQSMGAFAALAATAVLTVDAVLAFGPQFSVDPAIVPEDRWRAWTRRITAFRYPSAPLPTGPRITLFHGLLDDHAQAMAFPRQPGLDHILFPTHGHSGLCTHLKQRGAFAALIDCAISADRRRLLRICASAGGKLRHRLENQLPR